ncbi:MAG TPA: hypothetical protein VJ997_07935, partial [Longimicrobiales bacterium]|nr:hypothetical protein [Longimicrobiales bacterium]
MFKSAIKALLGSRHKREAKKLQPIIDEINGLAEGFSTLTDDELKAKTEEFRGRIGAATADLEAEIAELKEQKRHSEDGLERERLGQDIGGLE